MADRPEQGRIRLAVPSLDDSDTAAIARVLATGYLVQGPEVAAFEEALAAEIGVGNVVVVSNCTMALVAALMAIGIGPGSRVAVAAYSWPATVNAPLLVGADVTLIDIEPRTFGMDPEALERATGRERFDAVIPVHAFGGMCDIASISAIAARSGIPVVEDAACALGARVDGRAAGAWGRAGCFSFHPRKAITTGEGGAIATDDADLALRARRIRNHGIDPRAKIGHDMFVEPGFNLRLTEFQAALGRNQLGKLDRILASRRLAARRYDDLFTGTPVTPPSALQDDAHVYQSYVVLVPSGSSRDDVIAHLADRGIEATIGTYHQGAIAHRAGADKDVDALPATTDLARRALSLPLFEGLTLGDQERVVRAVLESL